MNIEQWKMSNYALGVICNYVEYETRFWKIVILKPTSSFSLNFKPCILNLELTQCTLCPRECGVNRITGPFGFCKSDADFNISSICVHKGEEPVISGKKGICNIFFPHCNLQCIYCQNHDISRNSVATIQESLSLETVIDRICETLEQTENIIGFVSPSHYIPQMVSIIEGLHKAGKRPVVVYNSNGYDKAETICMLEGLIDVYLPDFKYMDSRLAFEYSQARNYPEIALAALRKCIARKVRRSLWTMMVWQNQGSSFATLFYLVQLSKA